MVKQKAHQIVVAKAISSHDPFLTLSLFWDQSKPKVKIEASKVGQCHSANVPNEFYIDGKETSHIFINKFFILSNLDYYEFSSFF